MSNPWNGKVVLEVFWWNCQNKTYSSWYTYLAKLAPRLAAMGLDGIWTPPPCKDTGVTENMGYTPVDYYDIGQKNQSGGVATWFGSQDEFLRMIAVAHANGLEVYPDIVIDHCGGSLPDPSSPYGQNTCIQPKGFAGPNAGRWPRNWLDFHPNPQHANGFGDWVDAPDGPDFCYQGRCTDSGNGDPNCAARQNARVWFVWLTRQTGVDGFRFDDVKGYPPEVVGDVLWNAMGGDNQYFCVGEYVSGNTADVDAWAEATQNRSGTFDYPLRYALQELVCSNGYSDVGALPSRQQINRRKTVPFLNNHDTVRSPYWDSSEETTEDHTGQAFNELGMTGPTLDPDNPRTRLACAVAMTMDGSPQLFYEDLFVNHAPQRTGCAADAFPTRPWIENLVWCHQKLEFKGGDYFVRYQDSKQLLILERGARAIVAINNDGVSWHDAWISTAFPANTQLHDYSGSRTDDIWTNADGWVEIAVPPVSYSVWGPAGISGGFAPAPKRTVQQFEMDDDLGDSDPASPGYGGRVIPDSYRKAGAIWPAVGSELKLEVYADAEQSIDIQVIPPAGAAAFSASGNCGPAVPLADSFQVFVEGWHLLQARLQTAGAAPARLYVKVDYLAPATSDVF